jgi:hypothetical protein
MIENFFQLNSSKTGAMLIETPKQVTSAGNICPVISNLGIKFDPSLSFDAHIKHHIFSS